MMKRIFFLWWAVAFLLGMGSPSWAGDTKVPSLQGNTGLYEIETTPTLSKGGYSIGGHVGYKNYATRAINQKWILFDVTASYGLLDNLEVGMAVPSAIYQDDWLKKRYEGITDTTLGLKWRIIEEGKWGKWQPSLAIKPYTCLPSGSKKKGLGGDVVDWGINTIFSKEIGRFGLHLNLDNFYQADTDDPEFIIGAGTDFQATNNLALILEGYVSDERIAHDRINQFLGGIRYDLSNTGLSNRLHNRLDGLVVDAALGAGDCNGAPDFVALLGVSYTTDFFKKVVPPVKVKKKVPEVKPKVVPRVPPKPKEIRYIVVSGDTLWGLSRRHYLDPLKWRRIYDRNERPIEFQSRERGYGPALFYHEGRPYVLIFPEQELSIPPLPVEE